ncbi:MAG: TonB-dependent receptor [Balneolaceae bacterium]
MSYTIQREGIKQLQVFSFIKIVAVCFLFAPLNLLAQTTGIITGQVTDSTNNEPVYGANVFIEELSRGDATGANGGFRITNVAAGTYDIRFSYLGYKTKRVGVEVREGETTVLETALVPDYVMGEDIQVLAQAAGQIAAIKDQLQSNTIVNVVSSERISELPDQNAAESIGRLPGVSVQRNAGEAQKVVVRGLSPKFNSITVNGVRLPGTDSNDRSVDLSLIPSDVLGGIEVFKALTPDKDGDAVGGTVNLLIREAPSGFRGEVRAQTGYNQIQDEFGQYKVSFNMSNRFFDEKLGVLVTGSIQQADRSSEILEADYSYRQETGGVEIENLNLADILETRQRYGASLSVDYDLDKSSFFLSSFMGKTDRDEVRRRKRYRVGNGRVEYDLRDRIINNQVFSNSLRGEHNLDWLKADWQVSHSYSLTKRPYSVYSRFQELTAYEDGLIDNEGPRPIPQFARNNLNNTWFHYSSFDPQRGTDRDLTGELNFQVPFEISAIGNGLVKFGGKYRDKKRIQDIDSYQTDFGVVSEIGRNNPEYDLYNDEHIRISNFLNPEFSADNFLDGEYEFGPGLDNNLLNNFYERFSNRYDLNRFVELSDYTAGEKISAAYIMTELNLGSKLMILPGVRYEYTENFYEGKTGNIFGNLGKNGILSDTTGGQSYSEFLPMVHLKYSVIEGIDLRLAVTRTLSRPDYYNLIPSEFINEAEFTINRGNPDIKHTKAINYDAFLSFYKSSLGYFAVGAFYKELDDIDYITQSREREGEFQGYRVTQPINGSKSTVKGIEFDLQTDFRFLPKPLDGLILNTNVTFIESETFFPHLIRSGNDPEPPFAPIFVDTVRAGKLPGQPDFVASLTIGYEKGGFSGRVSYSYQKQILERVGRLPEVDIVADTYGYWDLSINQTFKGLDSFVFFLNANNFTRQSESSFTGAKRFTGENEIFGMTADAGVRYKF